MSDAPRSPGPPAAAPAATPVSSPKPVAPAPKTAAPASGVTPAATAPAPADPSADDELLEFLGSLDDAGGEDVAEWLQFLARADLDKVAKSRRPAPAAPKP